jgi:pimeloyl-ACP methyl ester carboxylesterase
MKKKLNEGRKESVMKKKLNERRKESVMKKKRLAVLLPLLVLVVLMPTIAAAQITFQTAYQVIDSVEEIVGGGLVRTVEIVQAGPNPIDKFEVVHVRHPDPSATRGSILLGPPLGTGFQFYENSDTTYYRDSIAGFLATRGFDVWGYSQRVQGLAPGTCESGAADCSVMAGWGLAQFVADAEYVRGRIVAENPGERPVVGGMSQGGMIGLAAINANPEAYRALIALDAGLYSQDPVYQAQTAAGCQALTEAINFGVYYDGQQIAGMKALNMLADVDPDGASPIFPGMTNLQAWVLLLSVPNPGPTSPTPNFIFNAGDWMNGTLTYADPAYLHRGFYGFVNYLTFAGVRDVNCSIAGLDGGMFISNLAAFDGPVFAVANGGGMDTIVDDTLALMPNASVTLFTYPDYGHQDIAFATDHFDHLEKPLLQWLATDAFAPDTGE